MTDLFAAKPVSQAPFTIDKSYLRGAIWLAALAIFVLLPKPDYGEPRQHVAEIAAR